MVSSVILFSPFCPRFLSVASVLVNQGFGSWFESMLTTRDYALSMGSIRISNLKSLDSSIRYRNRVNVRSSFARSTQSYVKTTYGTTCLKFSTDSQKSRANPINASPMVNHRRNFSLCLATSVSASGFSSVSDGRIDGFNLVDKSSVILKYTLKNAKVVSTSVLLYVHPYIRDYVVPVVGTLGGTFLAWATLPIIFRRFYNFSASWGHRGPYEETVWAELEDPFQYWIASMAFSWMVEMLVPTIFLYKNLVVAWTGFYSLLTIWFFYRLKTIMLGRGLADKDMAWSERESLINMDIMWTLGLGFTALAYFVYYFGVNVPSLFMAGAIAGATLCLKKNTK